MSNTIDLTRCRWFTGFLGIDFSKLASGGIDFIKNAAGKINGIVNQIGPYVNTAKTVLAAVSGDSFDEAPIPKELRKDHKDVTTALANVETKVDNIDAGWKQVRNPVSSSTLYR